MNLIQLTSAIHNNILSGLKGESVNIPYTFEQIEDEIINERISLIKELSLKGILPARDLMIRISCLNLDCSSLDKCRSTTSEKEKIKHFEIPQIVSDFGMDGIGFIGSKDGLDAYRVYTDMSWRYHNYKLGRVKKPFVWIDMTPNKNGKYDGFLFNNSFAQQLMIMLVPKDPRDLADYSCCEMNDINIPSVIDLEIEKRVTERLLRYYRLTAMPITPNDQTVKS